MKPADLTESSHRGFKSTKIMVVGDDSHFCYLMRSYVRRSTYSILFSNPGGDVLDLAQREQPAAIILDVDLPGLEGWNLLRRLKADPHTGEIPVVICSWKDEQEHGLNEGASLALRMPILYGDFYTALNTLGVKIE